MGTSPGERVIVVLGVLLLMAAAVWLVVLREPRVVVAHAAVENAASRSEVSGLAGLTSYVGVIVAGQDAELGAELTGEVVRVFREPGSRVRRGEPLLQLAALSAVGARSLASAQELEDRAAIQAAKLAWETANDHLARMQSAPSAYSALQLAGARSDAARAAAELDRLRGTTAVHRATQSRELARSNKQLVRAPFDGTLSARFLDVGDFANPGQALARVVDDERFVRFALPAPEHARLQVGVTVRVVPSGSSLPLTAAVVDIDPELDPAAGLGFARAHVPAVATVDRAELSSTAEFSPKLAPLFAPGARVEVFLPSRLP